MATARPDLREWRRNADRYVSVQKAIALCQQVSRNDARFPPDFMFRLSQEEAEALVSQKVIPSGRSLGGVVCQRDRSIREQRHHQNENGTDCDY
ncbi:MAG: ORF6N domain-containing protein [Planctomycetia bacterium]|nr:ORF6N domain-containing protein [Planctomycetia bacterium]